MPLDIGVFTTTYSICILVVVLGNASCPPSIQRCCWLACSPVRDSLTKRWQTKRRFVRWQMRYIGALFTHQFPLIWIDFRGIQDAFMRDKSNDYFENSRRATYVQRQYAIANPLGFKGYSANCWGLTACQGPGPDTLLIDGVERQFFSYGARGVPFGPDDGTIAPSAIVASLPFAAEIVLPAIDYFIDELKFHDLNPYGFRTTINPTCATKPDDACGWVSPWHFGINQGPMVLMIENYRSGLLWRLMRESPDLVRGLKRAGFSGGWL
ncbi:glucoamylase family protein [Thermomonas sp.]|uniref:glucoamylase family protein n=1 Tax=Thermomonas sp. TaxID=1971895 RepID=UPI002486E545|nr:glucoamylase family protein [Thermomonas sp.]MDI1253681.1 glucoamylase family protein [Thermomonas sp.]